MGPPKDDNIRRGPGPRDDKEVRERRENRDRDGERRPPAQDDGKIFFVNSMLFKKNLN